MRVGYWHTDEEPMQIVSGHPGRWIVRYEAPSAKDVLQAMEKFILWFNNTAPKQINAISFAPLRAAIAHLYFESIHPFEDGNGRIGRAVAEKALSQGFGSSYFKFVTGYRSKEKKYYEALHAASRSNEITEWIKYFVNIVLDAHVELEKQINFILQKTVFFDTYKDVLNERQLKVIRRMLQAGTKGFKGGMSAKKYMIIADTSKVTATRDLHDLLDRGIFAQEASGRSVRYHLLTCCRPTTKTSM